jgi:dihydroorotate dehydrogenase
MIKTNSGNISTVVISTALGQDGRGIFPYTLLPGYRRLIRTARETGTAILTKSFTRWPRRGNFIPSNPLTWGYIRRLPGGGMLNAYGLTNKGADRAAMLMRRAGDLGFRIIPNIYPEFARGTDVAIQETLEALDLCQAALGSHFRALELNYSCPNSAEEIRENTAQGLKCSDAVRRRCPELFLIAKISICHPFEFAQEMERLGIDAIHGINTVPFAVLFPERRSPLWQVGGGAVSGGPAWDAAFNYNRELRRQVKLPLIMGCGVRGPDDVQRYLDIGADAVSLCTLALRDPAAAARIIARYNS